MEKPKIFFAELLQKQVGSYVSYQMLLQTIEWHERRRTILDRDNNKCCKCKKWATEKQSWDGKTAINVWWDYSSVDFSSPYYGVVSGYKPPEIFGEKPIYTFNSSMAEIIADKAYHLEIHHKYYIHSLLPWQYDDEALITLCNWCHRETHETGAPIPVFLTQAARDEVLRKVADLKQKVFYYTSCSRCGGSGDIPSYKHVEGGVCFRCGGSGFDELRSLRTT